MILFRKLANQYAKLIFKNALIFKNTVCPLQLPVFDSDNKTFCMTNAVQQNKLEGCNICAKEKVSISPCNALRLVSMQSL